MMAHEEYTPLVSVVMPAYNAEKHIEAAVRSVMGQTMPRWELLVLDDGSADGTCAMVQKLAEADPRIRLLRNGENLGVARTRNRGIALCGGSYVALLDSDDVWHPEKLEKQLARMEQTGAALCYTSYAIVDTAGERVRGDYRVPETVTFDRLLQENVIGCSTVVLDAAVAKQHPFRTDFYHEDYALWLQLLQAGYRAVGCAETLTDWRYLDNSRSFDKRKAAANRWRIYRDYLKLPLMRSVCLFAGYALSGVRKYFRLPGKNAQG